MVDTKGMERTGREDIVNVFFRICARIFMQLRADILNGQNMIHSQLDLFRRSPTMNSKRL
eukprot:8920171-Pyramimonas_sp.AAC.1